MVTRFTPMATRPRRDERFTIRDAIDCVAIVLAIILAAYLIGRFAP